MGLQSVRFAMHFDEVHDQISVLLQGLSIDMPCPQYWQLDNAPLFVGQHECSEVFENFQETLLFFGVEYFVQFAEDCHIGPNHTSVYVVESIHQHPFYFQRLVVF